MEGSNLESLWGSYLTNLNWPERAISQYHLSLAKSTREGYNRMIDKCKQYCLHNRITFPPSDTRYLAGFICYLSDGTPRPGSVLSCMMAALSHVYNALSVEDLTQNVHIRRLMTAVIKSGTQVPMCRSSVLPTERFTNMFLSWDENETLSIKMLRIKVITLLALAFMLRPSDIAPNAQLFNKDKGSEEKLLFTKDQIKFSDQGLTINFFGIKNDLKREGFDVTIPTHKVRKLDPGAALQTYIERTDVLRSDNAVFLSLNRPYRAISAASVASVLEDSINLAGLGGLGYSAKSFRPTGATLAIQRGVDPHIVQKVGRWKSTEVFYNHYVHSKTPSEFVSEILK